jgi:hypothetical protein
METEADAPAGDDHDGVGAPAAVRPILKAKQPGADGGDAAIFTRPTQLKQSFA